MKSIEDCLNEKNPLSREVALFLLAYKEEDDRVDYKLTINHESGKDWFELTKDISAFANTFGGYLVLGVKNRTNAVIGLEHDVENILKDANNVLQKINPYLEPEIISLRAQSFKIEGKPIVILHTPPSLGSSHLIKKDGNFTYPSNKTMNILRKGNFYVRRSAGNHLGDSHDLEDLIERRIDQFREALLGKVARVVNSPTDSDLFILSRDPDAPTGERFIIEDSPESIPIKGMSFTVAPESNEEELAAWSVLSKGNSRVMPPSETVWLWYHQRDKFKIKDSHKLAIMQFSLWVDAPAFYWIRNIKRTVILEHLIVTIRNRPTSASVKQMLIIASFLGKGAYAEALKSLGDYKDRIPPAMRKFPASGARKAFGTIIKPKNVTIPQHKKEQKTLLEDITKGCVDRSKQPSALNKLNAQKYDCYLYSQDDLYKITEQ